MGNKGEHGDLELVGIWEVGGLGKWIIEGGLVIGKEGEGG
jgi:hypothetical protein